MKCVVTGQNATVLAKAIHSFARIGNELFVEADARTGLSLRTVNMTKSAFASVLFNLDFFADFIVKSGHVEENQCKLSMKSCLGVFRNMKQVESCTMTIDLKSCKMIVQFKCRLETIRTHHISILEHETLQAAYLTDRSLNVLGGNHKLFSNIVSSFKSNEEELSFKSTDHNVVIQNYAEGSHVDNRFVRSQITLKPDEFESFKIGESTTITFCMRELRAILNFAESMNTNISANFDTAGMPIVFVIKNFETFEANLVMSTLSPDDDESQCQTSRSLVQFSSRNENSSIEPTNAAAVDLTNEEDPDDSGSSHSKSLKRGLSENNDDGDDFDFGLSKENDVVRKKRRTTNSNRRDTRLPMSNNTNSSIRTEVPPPEQSELVDLTSEPIEVVFQEDSPHLDSFGHNDTVKDHSIQESDRAALNVRDHRPVVRHVFGRCFTGHRPQLKNLGESLAGNSDEE